MKFTPPRLSILVSLCLATASAHSDDRRVLPDHVPAETARVRPLRRLEPSRQLHLAIGLPFRDQQAVTAFLDRLYDPASPEYLHFLTPEEFTTRFGPSPADYEAVVHFAETRGLRVASRHSNRLLLNVEGPVAAVEGAFNITLKVFPHPREARVFFAPEGEPSVPASVPVLDVSGLSDYSQPQPHSRRVPLGAGVVLAPDGGSGPSGTYLPVDVRAAYAAGVSLTGAGQTVALVEFDGYAASDITAYETQGKLPAVTLSNVYLDGFSGTPVATSGQEEVTLDIEMVLAMASGVSKIIVYEGNPAVFVPNDVLNRIASDNTARQISCSWGWVGGPSASTDQVLQTMAAQGQAFVVASGDSDSFAAGAVDNTRLTGYPAQSPYVTSVGGTVLTTKSAAGAYSSETVWNTRTWNSTRSAYGGSSGGVSLYYGLPSWQQGITMAGNGGSTAGRNFPDVALTATNLLGIVQGNGYIFYGTSCAAPLWAGFAALVNQQRATNGLPPVGFLNPALYAIGKATNYPAAFHDVVSGDNTSPTLQNPYGSTTLFYAVPGYDLCVGWGTPGGSNLVNALSQNALPAAARFTATPANGVTPLTVTFTDLSSGTITNRSWSFGDGANLVTNVTALTHVYTTAGTSTVTLTVSGPLGVSAYTLTNLISATNPPAQLWASSTTLKFGTLVVGQSATQSVVVANLGGQLLSGTASTASPFQVVSNHSFSLGPAQTGAVAVAFSPSQPGGFTNRVVIASNGGSTTNLLTGTALSAGQIGVNPSGQDFGWTAVGATSHALFTVTNLGQAPISGGTVAVAPPFFIDTGGSFTLGGNSFTNVAVSFTPPATGNYSALLVFSSVDGGSSTNVVTGHAALPVVAGFTPDRASGLAPLTVNFTDTSSGTVTNRSWAFGDGSGLISGPLLVAHNYPQAGSFTVALTVTGPLGANTLSLTNLITVTNLPPQLWGSPTNLDFGTVVLGHVITQSVQVANLGGQLLTGTATSAPPFLVVSNDSYSVAPGATSLVWVAFSPAQAGAFTNVLILESNGGEVTNLLSGTAVTPAALAVLTASWDFGWVAVGSNLQQSFLVTNLGGARLTGGLASVDAPFSLTSGAEFTLAGYGATNLVLSFAPLMTGSYQAAVVVSSDDGGIVTNFVSGEAALPVAAGFFADVVSGSVPLAVNFTDASTGTITNRSWDFGDGSVLISGSPFAPHNYSQTGNYSVALTVTGPLGADTLTLTNFVTVTNPPPQIWYSPTNLDFGRMVLGQVVTQSVQVANLGGQLLTGTATSAPPFLVVSNDSYSVAPGATSLVYVAFSPAQAGVFTNVLILESNGGEITNLLSGTAVTPAALAVSPASWDFGWVAVGSSAQQGFLATNLGGAPLSGGWISVDPPFSFAPSSAFALDGYGATNLVLSFSPLAPGTYAAALVVSSDNAGSVTNFVSGAAALPEVASFTADALSGLVSLTVNFTDTSAGSITNRAWDFGDGATLEPGPADASHTYTQAGSYTVTLTVAGPLGTNALTLANLITVTNPPPQLWCSPTNLDFGTVVLGQVVTQSVQIANLGGQLLSGTATSAPPFLVVSNDAFTVAPGATGLVYVAFSPVQAGGFTNVLVLESNGGDVTNVLSGTAITPAVLAVLPASWDFGWVAVGSSAQQSFLVTNLGGAPLTGGTASVDPPFSLDSGAGFTLGGYGATNLVLSFAPQAPGSYAAALVFSSDAGGSLTNTLSGEAAIAAFANFTADQTIGLAPLPVNFTDTSTGTITNRLWSFGDGGTQSAAGAGVSHVYLAAGTNTVSLTVSGPLGGSGFTVANYIVVTNPPPVPPRFQSVAASTAGISLTWSGAAGTRYQLEYATGLSGPLWVPLGIPITATNSVVSALDVLPAENLRFYRVIVVSP